jgi:hypothetical protein
MLYMYLYMYMYLYCMYTLYLIAVNANTNTNTNTNVELYKCTVECTLYSLTQHSPTIITTTTTGINESRTYSCQHATHLLWKSIEGS